MVVVSLSKKYLQEEINSNLIMVGSGRGWELWRGPLKSARFVVAPMVDASELAWRMLSRKYGAELCYTPMLHSSVFVKDARYRRDNLASCQEDRPLIVQFCANDPEVFVEACRLAAPYCDAIDLNLGCPQAIARKGRYGAFLMEDTELIFEMIRRASQETDIPITAKIRIFDDQKKTLSYARRLVAAGASILTVHGRTRDQKGPLTGLADWGIIKQVKQSVNVPVFANGNIQYLSDVEQCLTETGVEGIMTAEGNLSNPAIFTGKQVMVWDMALEYLELAEKYPCPTSYSRGHVFKLLHHCLTMPVNFDLRHRLSKCSTIEEMSMVAKDIKDRMLPYTTGNSPWEPKIDSPEANLPFPPWVCQPYVRIPPEQHLAKIQERQRQALELKQQQQEEEDAENSNGEGKRASSEESNISKKKQKKLQKNPKKTFEVPNSRYEKCICKNPKGGKCSYGLCRACCRVHCYTQGLDCPGHYILVKTKREKAAIYYGSLQQDDDNKSTAGQQNCNDNNSSNGSTDQTNQNMMNDKNLIENAGPQINTDGVTYTDKENNIDLNKEKNINSGLTVTENNVIEKTL
ncbi:unnamed protein product, partial [Meganyctiphanes norvegica]